MSESPVPSLTLCGSISAHPVSLGAAMHRAGYQRLGLAFTYVPFAVTDIQGALHGMRALGIRGFGVSMPYKQQVIPWLDALDPLAQRIGAVNTIVNDHGHLTGYNTDWIGAVRALEEVTQLDNKEVLLLGAGGAAKAIAFGLVESRAKLTIANRNQDKAQKLANDVGAKVANLQDHHIFSQYEILVNATSVGMAEIDAGSPVPEHALSQKMIVMDIVYKPITTELVKAVRRQGAIAIHGGRMLLHQAAEQFRLYTGVTAPLQAMDEALQKQIG